VELVNLGLSIFAKILIILYNSLINSKLSYCLDSWGNASQTALNKILLLQKRILQYILKKDFLHYTAPLFKKTNILQIENLYKLKILQKAHKFYYSNTKKSLIVHSYSTRFSISNLLYHCRSKKYMLSGVSAMKQVKT